MPVCGGFPAATLLAMLALLPLGPPAAPAQESPRCRLWVDLCRGEPIPYAEIIADLATARVVYLGEHHTIAEHHAIQARIIADLGKKGVPLALGLEQIESFQQPVLERFNRKQINFDALAEAIGWGKRWPNYRQYQAILEAARELGSPIVALNAQRETIRQIARRGGVDRLDPRSRKELPAEVQLHDPPYEKLLAMQMMVHMAATPERLRPMIEAQIARDESMSAAIAAFLQSAAGRGRTMVVLCGAGHVAYALGTPQRVRRRMPGVRDRIVLLSESGDLELSPEEKAVSREISITHEQLRGLDRAVGDYLHAKEPAKTR
jgi:uncharacterized iron-regulated protein